jgi:hypothetical protein
MPENELGVTIRSVISEPFDRIGHSHFLVGTVEFAQPTEESLLSLLHKTCARQVLRLATEISRKGPVPGALVSTPPDIPHRLKARAPSCSPAGML